MAHNFNQARDNFVESDTELTLSPGTEVILVTYTNTTTKPVIVSRVHGTGNKTGAYRILFKSQEYLRGHHQGADLNFKHDVELVLNVGETVELRVKNCGRLAGDFYGYIHYHKPF